MQDKKRCKWNQILTNLWWKQPVIYAQSIRIVWNSIKIAWVTRKRETKFSDGMAAEQTSYRLYDMGDDFGSILRFTLDYRLPESFG